LFYVSTRRENRIGALIMVEVISFDIDGTLIDSYSGIPLFYRELLSRREEILGTTPRDDLDLHTICRAEGMADELGLLREDWWGRILGIQDPIVFTELLLQYWNYRIEHSRLLPGATKILSGFRRSGFKVVSISYGDDILGLKRYRISLAGLEKYFDDVIVVRDDIPSRRDAFEYIMKKYRPERIIVVDDKCRVLRYISRIYKNVTTVHIVFPYPECLGIKYRECGDIEVYNLYELGKEYGVI